jgi:5-methylcytosine-specific restriction endonuclease McrA
MNYSKHYKLLIKKAKNRVLEGYGENHHIIPRCFGGSNDKQNLVKLTAREHFIAHLLLYKMQTSKRKQFQMLTSVIMMSGKDKMNSTLYEHARKEFSKRQSERMTGELHPMYGTSRTGEENPFYGKTHSLETRLRLSELKEGIIIAKDLRDGKKLWVSVEDFKKFDYYVGITHGKKLDDDVKKKISEGLKRRPTLTCPHCGKEGKANMTRYHFDKCKEKENV